jgi:uncharacterized lipoprotein NlpE involved in copper resistance
MRPFAFLPMMLFMAVSCTEHRPGEQVFVNEQKQPANTSMDDEKLSGLRVYEGKIPCADCSGIEQHLSLRGDTAGIYRLREIYRDATEDGDSELVSSGEWKRIRTSKGYVYHLSEKRLNDSIRTMNYSVAGDQIVQLDRDGKAVDSSSHYRLKLVPGK